MSYNLTYYCISNQNSQLSNDVWVLLKIQNHGSNKKSFYVLLCSTLSLPQHIPTEWQKQASQKQSWGCLKMPSFQGEHLVETSSACHFPWKDNQLFRNLWSVICHLSSVICHLSSVIRHPSSVIRHLSSVICHLSSVICHLLSVICHLSSVICHYISALHHLQ